MATVNSSTSPPISSPGIGSGLDINGIVTKLVALERQPLNRLQRSASQIQEKVSSVGQIKSQMATLSDALTNLASVTSWNSQGVTSSDPNLVAPAVDGKAVSASYQIVVQQLARAQSVVSTVLSLPLVSGSLTFTRGQLSQGQFGALGDPVQINLSATDDLGQVAAKINASAAGVSATVLTDTSGQRLMITANNTGTQEAFRIDATPGLEALSLNPATATQAGSQSMGLAQAATNALATINGVPLSAQSNTYSGGIAGLSLTFKQTGGPVTLSIAQDSGAVKKSVADMVSAYNTLTTTFASLVKYDSSTKASGPFQGDSTITSIQFALRRLMLTPGPDGKQRLSDLGIKFQSNGNLAVDDAKLSATLGTQWSASKDFFTNSSTGVAVRLKQFADGILSTKGALNNKSESLQKLLNKNNQDQSAINDRADRVEADLRRQYNALDAKLGELNALNSYVTQQVNAWNNANSRN